MKLTELVYECHRFSAEIILYIVWLYLRFYRSHQDIEDLRRHYKITEAPEFASASSR